MIMDGTDVYFAYAVPSAGTVHVVRYDYGATNDWVQVGPDITTMSSLGGSALDIVSNGSDLYLSMNEDYGSFSVLQYDGGLDIWRRVGQPKFMPVAFGISIPPARLALDATGRLHMVYNDPVAGGVTVVTFD